MYYYTMLNKQIISIFFATLILFSSCVTTNIGRSTECRTTDCLRRTLGPPNKIIDNGESGEIWLYTETWIRSRPGKITVNDNTATYTNPTETEYQKYVKFWVDEETVYKWSSYGHKLKQPTTIGKISLIFGGLGMSVLLGVLLAEAVE